MKRLWRLVIVGMIAVALAGCATLQKPTRSSPENGAIFGYFVVPPIFGYLQYLSILRQDTAFKFYIGVPNDVHYLLKGGAFFAYDVPPGRYHIASIYTVGGSRSSDKPEQFKFAGDMHGSRSYNERLLEKSFFTVKPGELHYVGSTRLYFGRHADLPTNGTFSVGPVDTPTERQVLEDLLPALRGSPWQQPAEALLASLK